MQDWYPSPQHEGIYIIRNCVQLDFLRSSLGTSRAKKTESCTFSENDKACGLVLVGVELCGRGTLKEGAMICAMTKKDSKSAKSKHSQGPTELLALDKNEDKRKTLREAHLALLKRLRKKRVEAKRKLEENDVILIKRLKNNSKIRSTDDLVKRQSEVMRELWVPSYVETVKNSCSRCIMGYTVCGDFTFTQSNSTGYGYVTVTSLLSHKESQPALVLVRNLSSLQYHFARLKVL